MSMRPTAMGARLPGGEFIAGLFGKLFVRFSNSSVSRFSLQCGIRRFPSKLCFLHGIPAHFEHRRRQAHGSPIKREKGYRNWRH